MSTHRTDRIGLLGLSADFNSSGRFDTCSATYKEKTILGDSKQEDRQYNFVWNDVVVLESDTPMDVCLTPALSDDVY